MVQNTKKMKIVGTEQYTTKDGEVKDFQVISMEDRDFNFEKIWLIHILDSLEAVGNQKIKVMNTLLQLKDNRNYIHYTQDEIATEAKVGKNTVSDTISILEESNFLKKIRNGKYLINPDVIFKGKNKNRMSILLEYSKPINETQINENPDTFVQTDTQGDQIPQGTNKDDYIDSDECLNTQKEK